ncbi:Rieske 2Fe-2S domain-containing protein [Sphingobium sp.]|uniref:Rieske 2Fe-2S domain-containing protein n=1 Tax=Sphingobium sp. TaxID=1912891 RepID=UPI003BB72FE8
MSFLLDCWYFAGWLAEMEADGKIVRTIADRNLLIFPDGDGGFSAVLDQCPHRLVPLSCGQVEPGRVTCGYHGLQFGRDGACLHNPHGPVLDALRVQAFPVVARHDGLWIWLGDASSADPALIPDLGFIDQTKETAKSAGYEHIAANYLLCVDNILDLSHADYLHPSTLGGGSATRAKSSVSETDDGLRIKWEALDDIVPPALATAFPNGRGDVRLRVDWWAPGVMKLDFGASQPGDPAHSGPMTYNAHIMTPKNAFETHYFFCNSRNFMTDDAAFNSHLQSMLRATFAGEDKPMLEAQQRSIGNRDIMDSRPVLLRTDAGSARMRRLLSKRIASEHDIDF